MSSTLQNPEKLKVVCLVDNSEAALNALAFYIQQFHKPQNEIYIFHAIIPNITNTRSLESDKVIHIIAENQAKISNLEYEIDKIIMTSHCQVKIIKKLEPCEDKDKIGKIAFNYVKEIGADMIVSGTRNLTGLKKVMNSSVSEYLLKHATCPVFIHKS